jgi:phage repressor protein C with HTH and peptisase S24 domain
MARSSAAFFGVRLVVFMDKHLIQESLAMQARLVLAQGKLADTIPAMDIHKRIKALRLNLGLTQTALGNLVDVKYQAVQQWEKGKTAPERKLVEKLAKALNTTPEYLLFGTLNEPEGEQSTDRNVDGGPESEKVLKVVPLGYSVDTKNFRRVFVVGRGQGGLAERLWTDGDYPVGATDEFAEIATSDPHAFLTPVVGLSMVPRFNPGEFAFVEPGTEPEAGDDVLVRLVTGETLIKKLASKRGGVVELQSYNEREQGPLFYKPEEISWMYYIAHPVPARKIKTRM